IHKNNKLIMELQEEIISSWWEQGKALLNMCGVSRAQMRLPCLQIGLPWGLTIFAANTSLFFA
ncbi:hypothetical protein, partial [Candidatus Magnetaquicoccus inordinatus]|uniref:hypothetical protein n=1 Tax=Candidatus Magnetaquicoccus inordinatus TaxID=2496818 RepID=UPI001D0EA344